MSKKSPSEPSIKIATLQRILESELEASSNTPKSSGEEYLVIDRGETEEHHKVSLMDDETASESPLSNTPILPEVLSSRSTSSNETPSLSRSPVPSFDMIGTDEIIKALPISRVTGLESASEAAKDLSCRDSRQKAEGHFFEEHDYHFDTLMIQLIKSFGLSLSWLDVVKPLVKEAVRKVKTNILQEDMMDINQYVKVKKIPGGRQSNTNLVYGVVCTKNVTHKKMETSVRNPSILLLRCAFEFQRRELSLSYFDTLQLQEEQYLKNVVAKVKAFKPSIILVQKSMSRLALEMLYELGIIVAVNVKPSVMNRVARCTEGAILSSLDQLFFDVRLGHCGHFFIRNYTLPDGVKKTLMYFDQCEPQYGCVITLQGASNRELKKVKKITQFGLHIAHNSNLETAFLIDEFAWPKLGIAQPPKLLPSSDDYSPTPSTPEWPLYPSVAYPLDSLSAEDLTEKLRRLGGEEEKTQYDQLDGEEEEECLVASFDGVLIGKPEEEERQELPHSGGEGFKAPSASDDEISSSKFASSEPHLTDSTGESKADDAGQTSVPDLVGDTAAAVAVDGIDRVESGLVLKITSSGEEETSSLVAAKLADEKTLEEMSMIEFQKAMECQILSISPGVQLTTPYLQTVKGRKADARQYLPKVIYWSNKFSDRERRDKKIKSLNYKSSYLGLSGSGDPEMGIVRGVASGEGLADGSSGGMENQNGMVSLSSYQHQPSYKSVSTHPLTSSIFLLHANTNEMKSALADYRARASLPTEGDGFFFPSARLACNYQLHLQNVFNSYKHFNFDLDLVPSSKEHRGSDNEREGDGQVAGRKKEGRKKKGRKSKWQHGHGDRRGVQGHQSAHETLLVRRPRLASCSHDNPLESDEFENEEEEEEEREERKNGVQGREESVEPPNEDAEPAEMAKPTTAQDSSKDGIIHSAGSGKEKDVLLSDDSHKSSLSKSSGNHKATGGGSSSSRFSDKFVTLDDLDKGHTPKSRGNTQEEENFEQWATGDQVGKDEERWRREREREMTCLCTHVCTVCILVHVHILPYNILHTIKIKLNPHSTLTAWIPTTIKASPSSSATPVTTGESTSSPVYLHGELIDQPNHTYTCTVYVFTCTSTFLCFSSVSFRCSSMAVMTSLSESSY